MQRNLCVLVHRELMYAAFDVLALWMEGRETLRLRLAYSNMVASPGGGGRWSCEHERPDHLTGKVLPPREPWRWYHKGSMALFCVECRRRISRCGGDCEAHLASRIRLELHKLLHA